MFCIRDACISFFKSRFSCCCLLRCFNSAKVSFSFLNSTDSSASCKQPEIIFFQRWKSFIQSVWHRGNNLSSSYMNRYTWLNSPRLIDSFDLTALPQFSFWLSFALQQDHSCPKVTIWYSLKLIRLGKERKTASNIATVYHLNKFLSLFFQFARQQS